MRIRRKKLDWLWMLWEVGILDGDNWPPEEVECD